MSKIFDVSLLDETINYNDNEGNFDRIVAAELAIALAMKLDPLYGAIGGEGDVRIKAMYDKKPKKQLFASQRGLFTNTKKLF